MEERLDDAINVLRNHAESLQGLHALAQSGLTTHSSVNGLLASYPHGEFSRGNKIFFSTDSRTLSFPFFPFFLCNP